MLAAEAIPELAMDKKFLRLGWWAALPGAATGAPSLHRQLFIWLLLPQIIMWLAAGLFTYNLAARYANQAVDATLSQASRALARQVKPQGNGLLIDFPRAAQDILESDPSDRVLYTVSTPPGQFILGNRNLPPLPTITDPVMGEPYFYDGILNQPNAGADKSERVRVAALYLRYGDADSPGQTMLVQVARSSTNREELARQIMLDLVLPLSALIALKSAGASSLLPPIFLVGDCGGGFT